MIVLSSVVAPWNFRVLEFTEVDVCDQIYHRYLEYEMYKECADKVCFVTPDVTQFIKLYEGIYTPQNNLFICINIPPSPIWLHSIVKQC